MKIAVVGSREFKDKKFFLVKIGYYFFYPEFTNDMKHPNDFKPVTLVSGGALGVDSWAEKEWKDRNFPCIIFKPDWNKYRKRAGFLRNELIINEADKIVAFWDGQSKGTKHSIDLAIKKGIPVDIYIRQ